MANVRKSAGAESQYVEHVAGGAITVGSWVDLGTQLGVAQVGFAASGSKGAVLIDGVVSAAKSTSSAAVAGARAYWDAGNSHLTSTAGQHAFVGIFAEDRAETNAFGLVKLRPFSEDAPRGVTGNAATATTLLSWPFRGGRVVSVRVPNTDGVVLNLPASASVPQFSRVRVEKTNAAAEAITVTPAGADTVNGTTTHAALDANGDWAVYELVGTNWAIIDSDIA